jgi:HEAT repeat protein
MKKSLMLYSLISLMAISSSTYASIEAGSVKNVLLQKYMSNYESKNQLAELKTLTLAQGGKSVEALIEVMKNGKYPDKNRWVATFMLGQIMGDKSAPFLAKFLKHPSWFMRMASLKTLLALKQDSYGSHYGMLLNDESLMVRTQALENIRRLKISSMAPNVWAMLYDKKNYYQPTLNGKELKRKRTNIIKSVVLAVGELKFEKARSPLLKMIQKDRYNDISPEIDLALNEITGLHSPKGDLRAKRLFWQRSALDVTIN